MILGAGLALAAAVAYGVSDVVSGSAVRRHSTAALALWSQLTGLAVLGGIALAVRPVPPWPGVGWGALAGGVGAVGVLAFYTALQRGPTAVVAPVAGAGVLLPLAVGVVGGEEIGPLAGVGTAAAVVGVLVVAATSGGDGPDESGAPGSEGSGARHVRSVPGRAQPVPVHDGCVPDPDRRSTRSAVGYALLAAAGFGGVFVLLDLATAATSDPASSVAIALAVQVGALVVTAAAATGHTRACLAPRRRLLAAAALVAVLDAGADLLLVVAVGIGPLAVVGPLASLDPVVSVVIAAAVLGERLRALQVVGVVAVLAGVVLVAVS